MREEKLRAVHVSSCTEGDEYHEVGRNNCTEIKWSVVSGHMANIDTIQVFKNGALHSEHPFTNCLSVYFASETEDPRHG